MLLVGVLLWAGVAQLWERLMVLSKEEPSSCSFPPCTEKAEHMWTEQCAVFGAAAAVPSPSESYAQCVASGECYR